MECYKRLLLLTVISLLKSFPFFLFPFPFSLKKKKPKKRIKVRILRFHCSHLSMNFPNTSRTIILDSPLVRRRKRRDVVHSIPRSGIRFPRSRSSAARLLPQDYIAIPLCNRRRYHAPFFIPFTSLCPLVTLSLSRGADRFVSSSLDEGRRRNLIWFPDLAASLRV